MAAYGQPFFDPPPPMLFHGTPAANLPQIDRQGLKFAEFEPCFTIDLCVAACKYAHFGYSHSKVTSGEALRAARALARAGKIAAKADNASLLEEARHHWDRGGGLGSVLLLGPGKWKIGPSVMSSVRVDSSERTVRGGLTKWIEMHLSPYEPRQARGQLVHFSRRFTEGRLWRYRRWRDDRSALHIPPGQIGTRFACDAAMLAFLRAIARCPTAHCSAEGVPASLRSGFARIRPETLVEALRGIRLATELRRITLSLLRDRGFRMIKTDTHRVMEEPKPIFWSGAVLDTRIDSLASFVAHDIPKRRVLLREALAAIERLGRDEGLALEEALCVLDRTTGAIMVDSAHAFEQHGARECALGAA